MNADETVRGCLLLFSNLSGTDFARSLVSTGSVDLQRVCGMWRCVSRVLKHTSEQTTGSHRYGSLQVLKSHIHLPEIFYL